jgi:hypothetical protein
MSSLCSCAAFVRWLSTLRGAQPASARAWLTRSTTWSACESDRVDFGGAGGAGGAAGAEDDVVGAAGVVGAGLDVEGGVVGVEDVDVPGAGVEPFEPGAGACELDAGAPLASGSPSWPWYV